MKQQQQVQGNKFGKMCETHKFCSVGYDFKDENKSNKEIQRERVLEKIKFQREKQVNFQLSGLTEEALDDWIFQSFNRPLMCFLDPKKKFEVVNSYLEELKTRYYQLRISNKMVMEAKEYYFSDDIQIPKKQKFVLQNGKAILNPNNLLFDHQLLVPREIWQGQKISFREESKLKMKRRIESRRSGLYLFTDETYQKLQIHIESQGLLQSPLKKDEQLSNEVDESEDEMKTSIENQQEKPKRELKYFSNLMPKLFQNQENDNINYIAQEDMQSESLQSIKRSLQQNKITDQQIELSKQHMMFKRDIESLVKEFKDFLRENNNREIKETNQQDNKLTVEEKNMQQTQQQTHNNNFKSMRSYFRPQSQSLEKRSNKFKMSASFQVTPKKQNISIAQQMIQWYENSKDDRPTIPLEVKQEIIRLNSLKQKRYKIPKQKDNKVFNKNLTGLDQKPINKNRRHFILKTCENMLAQDFEIFIQQE